MNSLKEITNETDALRDILEWSTNRPLWQRDAIRRIVTQGELNENDINELAELCKNPLLPSTPLSKDQLNHQHDGLLLL